MSDKTPEQRIKELETEIEQLKGEKPMPQAWWKECPKLAQKVMERIIEENEQLQAELEKHRWIPVSERLPNKEKEVSILAGDCRTPYIANALLKGGTWHIRHPNGIILVASWEITHWKPIILPGQEG